MNCLTVSAHVTGDSPVINHVVDVLHRSLGFGIAALVIDPKVMREGDIVALAKAAESLGINPFADQAILERDILGFGEPDAIPSAPFDGNMIDYDVLAIADSERCFALTARGQALPE